MMTVPRHVFTETVSLDEIRHSNLTLPPVPNEPHGAQNVNVEAREDSIPAVVLSYPNSASRKYTPHALSFSQHAHPAEHTTIFKK